jgi:MerR family transcriptional regulator/heat shock protein HspR
MYGDEQDFKYTGVMNDAFRGDRPLFSISTVTELTGVSQQALRGYEENGLVRPHRSEGGTRRYSRDDVERVTEIARLLDTGLNHVGVAQVMELQAEVDRMRQEIRDLRDAGAGS